MVVFALYIYLFIAIVTCPLHLVLLGNVT
uniref:Uncharacterized protein n=1 Tax=Rhizophora mucronata TaxID=61149 RepID=A0A2P2LPE9_RHIMU